ncbi:MAG: MHS family MFS transporter [Acidisphaera sp.]|nr:MHS family MFS transporter [Acidisphaera sp.]
MSSSAYAPTLSAAEHRRMLTRAAIAATIGTTIEWYDFFLYGTATGLVFASLYFPNSDPLVGTLNAFGIYAVGFIARPIGAIIFGHFGDRIGRKSTLIATLMLMGIATVLVGCVPTYATIGIWGAIILTALRFVQGVGVGGEWGGSVLLSMEWSRGNSGRGLAASWPQLGVAAGLFTSNLAVLIFSAWSGSAFLTWGWRIPFLLSIVLIAIGLWIRLGVEESPSFKQVAAESRIDKAPALTVIAQHPRLIILSALARMGEQAPFYIFTAFVFAYGVGTLKVSRELLLFSVMLASVLSVVTIPLSGHLSDRFGRRRMYMWGAALTGVYGFIYVGLLNTTAPLLVFIAVVLSLIPHDIMYGPQAALIAEGFPARLRYSGASIGYQLASIIAGGPAPLIVAWLLAQYKTGWVIAYFTLACAVISLIATSLMPDHTNKEIAGT